MHILITADAIGGVWTYTQELTRGLLDGGYRVTLVSFGSGPHSQQTRWMNGLKNFDFRQTPYRLEWMQDFQKDVEHSRRYLARLIAEIRPNLLHSNQYCFGDLPIDIPRIVVAHSDVLSWWGAVHGSQPDESKWIRSYRDTVRSGVKAADVVVAPSRWMLNAVSTYHAKPNYGIVIHNGVSTSAVSDQFPKENIVLSAGRLWDHGKQVSLLMKHQHPVPIEIAGSNDEPGTTREFPGKENRNPGIRFLGTCSTEKMEELYSRASIYVATSRYEPFGLAPAEAALHGCALILNDIPSFRELWADAAFYFKTNDADDLAEAIRMFSASPELRSSFAELARKRAHAMFRAGTMIAKYDRLYQRLTHQVKAAA